ncbi:hypothetical protein CBS147343_9370 [Aspergillus niger]|nr:hypothetical protein CBS12448_7810 [Aspergillus niger]KAI2915647.1 hypothetical protein CBS147371_5639 [Aspergillus niger]KAI2933087.1 hypothetical protein CBS147320_1606 [Aspergillus niger]KAI2940347.1 hypothetical protein CBS147321_6286 [Aspergillus niger]KAI2951515.1 hypothetical protein CBS147322_4962 [Aspergillus niger]
MHKTLPSHKYTTCTHINVSGQSIQEYTLTPFPPFSHSHNPVLLHLNNILKCVPVPVPVPTLTLTITITTIIKHRAIPKPGPINHLPNLHPTIQIMKSSSSLNLNIPPRRPPLGILNICAIRGTEAHI